MMAIAQHGMGGADELLGRIILLVEDNFLVGMSMRKMLEEMGCRVIGPIAVIGEAERVASETEVDAGVLDINIIGGTSVGVAERLSLRGTPYIFVTGYGSPRTLPESLKGQPRLSKPVDERGLGEALRRAVE
jgi:DNA-binding NtrC family response regulator